MIKLIPIDQGVFDRVNSDTAQDIPCILMTDGDYGVKLSLAEACELQGRLGELTARLFESAKTSLRARQYAHSHRTPFEPPSQPTSAPVAPAPAEKVERRSELASFLHNERRSRGLSQKRLAKMAGLKDTTISMIEADRTRARDDTLRLLAKALCLDAAALLKLKYPPKRARTHAA